MARGRSSRQQRPNSRCSWAASTGSPLHPVGFVVSGTWIMDNVWFSIFLAWMIKAVVLKYAGPGGYRTTRWFVLGIILGQFVVGGFWLVIDGFTGMKGHRIRMY